MFFCIKTPAVDSNFLTNKIYLLILFDPRDAYGHPNGIFIWNDTKMEWVKWHGQSLLPNWQQKIQHFTTATSKGWSALYSTKLAAHLNVVTESSFVALAPFQCAIENPELGAILALEQVCKCLRRKSLFLKWAKVCVSVWTARLGHTCIILANYYGPSFRQHYWYWL